MNIRIGKIDNISKKMIAGALVFTLTFSSMVGYAVSSAIESNRQKYENFEGVASFEKLKKCYFIEVMDKFGDTKYYLAEKIEVKGENYTSFLYLDVVNGKNILSTKMNTQAITKEINMGEYLSKIRNKKSMYSVDDINAIIDDLKVNNKKMIK